MRLQRARRQNTSYTALGSQENYSIARSRASGSHRTRNVLHCTWQHYPARLRGCSGMRHGRCTSHSDLRRSCCSPLRCDTWSR